MRARLLATAGSSAGFTLIEVIVAFTLFLAIALPMMAGLYASSGTLRAQEALTATWLLEQEAASIRLFTNEGLAVKRRIIDGKEWTVRISSEGAPLVRYTLSAWKQGKKRGEVVVYGTSRQ